MQLPPLPAEALVVQERIPNIYDKTQLRLDVSGSNVIFVVLILKIK